MPECVVVGAGPVGLTAALALRRRGVDVLVLEAEPPGRERPGSRAIFLMQPTLHRLELVQPGLGSSIAADGIQVSGYETFYGERRVCRLHTPSASAMSLLGLGASPPQRVSEMYLYDAAVQHGVQFRWSTPVSDVRTDPDGATVVLAAGAWLANGPTQLPVPRMALPARTNASFVRRGGTNDALVRAGWY